MRTIFIVLTIPHSALYKMLKNQVLSTATVAIAVGLLGACNQPFPTAPSNPVETAAASSSPIANPKAPKVVATTTVLCDLTRQIATNTVNLICPIKAGSDPHIYESTPEDRKAIEEATLILYGGYDFEPSLIKIIRATSNAAPKVAVSEVAVPNPLAFEHEGEGHEDNNPPDQGHRHNVAEADPHVWNSARNGIRMVEAIQSSLAKVIPENAALYGENAQAMTTEIAQIDDWIKAQIATIPLTARKLVTTHDALGYYSKAYNIPVEGALGGISTKEKPTARRVAELVDIIRKAQVPTIFAESSINPKLIETVAKDAGVKVSDRKLFADGLGDLNSGGETYQKMLIANTKTIVEGLGGQYRAFQPK
jgi:manganese/iron transport system substrate-binding protein